MRYLVGTFLCSAFLFAQTETLVIDADNFQGDDKKGISTFTGNVKIKKGQDKLNANKVDIFFVTDKKTNNRTPQKYEATGKADFEIFSNNKHYIGSGDKVVYIPQNDEYTIIGNGYLEEKVENRKVYGDEIYVNQLSGEAKVKGNENKPVRFIINVDKGQNKGESQ